MKARILEKSEEELWGKFLQKHSLATIHQTPAWGHFQEKISSREKYWIVVLEEDGKIIGGTILIRHKLPKNFSWLYAARGPLVDYHSKKEAQNQMDELLKAIKPLAKEEKSIFLRIDPPLKKRSTKKTHKFKHFHITHSGFQPEHTLVIDLTKSKDDILKQMKQKGRYNIRLAKKRRVNIYQADPLDPTQFSRSMDAFYEILLETTKRNRFFGHNKDFYETMLNILIPTENATLYLAEYNNKIISGIIVASFKDTATYYYGASSNEYRNVMAPYLLQWHAMKEAKHQHLKYYDFFGVAPTSAKRHPWQGVTEFKQKFGGQKISYSPPQEIAFKSLLHFLYRIYKFFRAK